MEISRDYKEVFAALNAAEARFLVIGAYAVMFYATPRYTKDIDIWVEPTEENAKRVYQALAEFGAPLEQLNVEDLSTPGVVFQIGVEPNRVDILTAPAGLSFPEAWSRRESSTYGGEPIQLLSLPDLLEAKRQAGRPQDLLDIDNLTRAAARRTDDSKS